MVLKPTRRRRAEDDRGVVLVVVALSLVALLTIAALVVDLGFARQTARFQQGAMDAASLAGVRELPATPTADPVNDPIKATAARAKAAEFAWKSLFEGTPPPVPVPTCSGARCTYEGPPYSVVVESPYTLAGSTIAPRHLIYTRTCRPSPTFLAQVFGGAGPTVCRESVARAVQEAPGAGIGMIALGPSGCTVELNGNNNITVTGGAVIANSAGTPAICATGTGCGNWRINASLVSAVGTVDCEGNMPGAAIVENGRAVPDPYRDVPDTPCSTTTPSGVAVVPQTTCLTGAPVVLGSCRGVELLPGRYPGGCNLGGGNATVDLLPGVYWFDGTFNLRNHDVTCVTCTSNNGVLLYFHSGSLDASGNGKLLTPPYRAHGDANPFAGLSVYQRRGNTTPMTLGGTTGNVLGSLYAPDARLRLHGTADREISGLLVARSFEVAGTTTTSVSPPPSGPKTDPIVDIGLER